MKKYYLKSGLMYVISITQDKLMFYIFLQKIRKYVRFSVEGNLRGGFAMEWYQMDAKKCLEFSKKMAVLRRLVHLGLISENEYILAKNKIMSSYHILESEYFKTGAGNRVA